MKTMVEELFFENEQHLTNRFNFEELGQQLDFLANCSGEFSVQPSTNIQNTAAKLHDHLIKKGWIDNRQENTLIYTQSRNLIREYLSYCEKFSS